MDIVNQRVSRSQGATAFGTDSYQQIYSQYKSSFTFISGTLSYGESITLPVPQAVDSCWTTGNIFRLDNDSGIVKNNYIIFYFCIWSDFHIVLNRIIKASGY